MSGENKPVRIGVVGLGVMGERHARGVAAHPKAILSAVVDIDTARRDALARELNATAYDHVEKLIGQVDAAIVAVPTAAHAAVATVLLDAGIPCLVEKPFVSTATEGAELAKTAQRKRVALQVGHIERFNPAVTTLLSQLTDRTKVRNITARRMNAASARVTDIDVIMDLMVHDIDTVIAIKQMQVMNVSATGDANHAEAVVTFMDKSTARITASRTQPGRVRDLHVDLEDCAYDMDYVARTLTKTAGAATIAIPVPAEDALTAQLTAFVDAVGGKHPVVSAASAMAVMDVAWRVQMALGLRSS